MFQKKVVLPGECSEYARLLAERIRMAAVAMRLPRPCSPSGMHTISLGVAALVPDAASDVAELVAMADLALYQAKGLGRNRVMAV